MSNLLWKRKKKWKPKQKQKATGQWKWRKRKKKEKKKERETWTLLNTAYGKRKKERTDIFSKIDSTSLHRLKKEEKKTEHFWTVIVTLFWLVKWKFLSLFEFKGDIRIFFSCSYYEIWREPLTEDFILGLMIFEIILILKFFFRIWGFRGIGNIFWGFLFLRKSWADVRVGQTFIQGDLQIVVESNSIEEFADPWSCRGPIWVLFLLVWSSEDGIKEKRRGLLQNLVDDVYVFQSRWCFGFVCDLAKWNEPGKGDVPIYW